MMNSGGLEGPEGDEPEYHPEELEGQDDVMQLFIVPADPPRTRQKRVRGKQPAAQGSGAATEHAHPTTGGAQPQP